MDKYFKAPWDTMLRSISALTVVIMLGFPLYDLSTSGGILINTGHPIIIRLVPAILIILLLFMIRSYKISGNALLVRRLFWNTRIELSDIRSALYDPEGMKGSIKTIGNGGVFSYSGWFYSKKLGKFRALATNRAECVVLNFTDGKTILISPENPQMFLESLRELGVQINN